MELKDIQNKQDKRGIDIQKVGIKDIQIPLLVERKNDSNQIVNAKARMSVSLPKKYKGTHMSRFVEVLNEYRKSNLFDLYPMLDSIKNKLSAQSAEVEFAFTYFIEKKAPVSKMSSLMGYDCSLKAELQQDDYKFYLGVKVPVTTLCPCSKEISNNGAHNQRAKVSLVVSYGRDSHIWLEDLIEDVEKCASCPIYPLLKRQDEKFVTEKAYDNPKFVEDVIRDVIIMVEKYDVIDSYEIEIEAFESIHNHSAWAYQKKDIR